MSKAPPDAERAPVEHAAASTDDEWSMSDDDVRVMQIQDDMGASYEELQKTTSLKKRLYEVMYHPVAELAIFFLILLSVALLAIEVSAPEKGAVGWMGGISVGEMTGWFFWIDVALTVVFASEYSIKLWLAPRKWYFVRHNWVDLLAILPILRVLRIGRAVRLLRLFRLLRMVRVGKMVSEALEGLSHDITKNRGDTLVIVIYMIFSIIFGSVGILVFEKGAGSGFESLGDGLWWCIVTLTTVGYGDISPVTTGGKLVAGVLMFVGLSFYALLTGFLSTALIERAKRKGEQKMELLTLENHVIICGWNANGERLIQDLRSSEPKRDIVVVSEREDIPELLDSHVHYLHEDPATAKALDKARLPDAGVVVVLSDQGSGRSMHDADARAVLITLAVERRKPEVHTIVELNDEDNVFHVKNAGVDEVIVSQPFTGTMVSQAVQNPGISEAFQNIFQPGKGAYFSQRTIDEKLAGKTFRDLAQALLANGGGVLVGYRRGKTVEMAPQANIEFKKGDTAILLKSVEG